MPDNHDNDAIPEAPPGYHAAIGRIGGQRKTGAQRAASVKNISHAHKLTPEQRAAIVTEHAGGASVADLAAAYGVTRGHVYNIVRPADPVARKRKPQTPTREIAVGVAAVISGLGSPKEIAERLDIPLNSLRRAVARDRKRRAAEVAESEEK